MVFRCFCIHITNSITNFIRYNKSWSCQALLFMTVLFYIGLSSIRLHYNHGECWSYIIARSCGAVLKIVLMPSIIPPISRVLFTEIRNSKLGKFVGLDRRIADHKLFAYGAGGPIMIHIIAHIFRDPNSLFQWVGITGILMVLAYVLPIFGVFLARKYISSIRKYSYSTQVIRPHQVGAAVIVWLYAIHVPDHRLVYYAIAMYGTFILDRILEYFRYTFETKISKAVKIESTDYVMLSINKPKNFGPTLSGQFVLLSFPGIDAALECYHPFTIANDDGKVLTFLIKREGKWTTNLFELINEKQTGIGLKIIVIGPYGSTLNSLYENANILLTNEQYINNSITFIATGIGMTQLLSFLNHGTNNKLKLPFITIHISQRTLNEFVPFIEALNKIEEKNEACLLVYFYITNKSNNSSNDIKNLLVNDIMQQNAVVKMERPDFKTIIKYANQVIVCGNKNIVKEVSNLSLEYNKRCHVETF